jgi:hypothetical protein
LYTSEFENILKEELAARLSHQNHANQLGSWNALSLLAPRFSFARKLRENHWPRDKIEQQHTARFAGGLKDFFEKRAGK